jgi:hypothetical protein
MNAYIAPPNDESTCIGSKEGQEQRLHRHADSELVGRRANKAQTPDMYQNLPILVSSTTSSRTVDLISKAVHREASRAEQGRFSLTKHKYALADNTSSTLANRMDVLIRSISLSSMLREPAWEPHDPTHSEQ